MYNSNFINKDVKINVRRRKNEVKMHPTFRNNYGKKNLTIL